jgi:hypothetical protein
MSVVRLGVLCDEIFFTGHSVNGSVYVGNIWHWWLWLRHMGTERVLIYCVAFALSKEREL